jgi:hypothetical protein
MRVLLLHLQRLAMPVWVSKQPAGMQVIAIFIAAPSIWRRRSPARLFFIILVVR